MPSTERQTENWMISNTGEALQLQRIADTNEKQLIADTKRLTLLQEANQMQRQAMSPRPNFMTTLVCWSIILQGATLLALAIHYGLKFW